MEPSSIWRNFFTWRVRPADVARDWGVLAALATVAALFARTHWLADLASHFAVHYLIVLLPATAWMVWRRRWRMAGFLAVPLALNLWAVWPALASRATTAPPDAPRVRVLGMNVLTKNSNGAQALEVIRAAGADVVVLQEISPKWMESLAPLRETHPHVIAQPQEDNFGIALFSRLPLERAHVFWSRNGVTPCIRAEVLVAGRRVLLLAAHPPPPVGAWRTARRNDQFGDLRDLVRAHEGPALVVADFNAAPWNPNLRGLAREAGLRVPPAVINPSWPSLAPRWLRIPIDLVLPTRHWQFAAYHTLPAFGSDHLPVLAELALVD